MQIEKYPCKSFQKCERKQWYTSNELSFKGAWHAVRLSALLFPWLAFHSHTLEDYNFYLMAVIQVQLLWAKSAGSTVFTLGAMTALDDGMRSEYGIAMI